MNAAIYESVTERITAALSAGVVPWRKPWHSTAQLPANGLSNRAYRGINAFLLSFTPYRDHRWLTLLQANQLGGRVKAGEKSTTIVFWKRDDIDVFDEETGEVLKRRLPILKTYAVFNVEQCSGVSLAEVPEDRLITPKERIERAESLVQSMPNPPTIREGGTSAWYRPLDDHVQVPLIDSFDSADSFYSTLFHELGHATGHESRLKRPGVTASVQFGSGEYGHEELVAELTSAYVSATAGLDTSVIENAASYIDSWLKVIKGNPKMLVIAAAQAQRAADYVFGTVPLP